MSKKFPHTYSCETTLMLNAEGEEVPVVNHAIDRLIAEHDYTHINKRSANKDARDTLEKESREDGVELDGRQTLENMQKERKEKTKE